MRKMKEDDDEEEWEDVDSDYGMEEQDSEEL
jgi:hypothetical protein